MGRSEGNSSAGAIAVIVIGGVLLLLLLGAVGVGAVGFLFLSHSSPQVSKTYAVAPTQTVAVERVITGDAEGTILVDGQSYNDVDFAQLLASDAGASHFVLELPSDFPDHRREVVTQALSSASANWSVSP
jgi:hypothetical protein